MVYIRSLIEGCKESNIKLGQTPKSTVGINKQNKVINSLLSISNKGCKCSENFPNINLLYKKIE